ncbi:hypothetical protein BDA96_09G177400 [Sorghum bicolor]|uniref:Uncharacterized protein n=2 Tax=Sorghum bicolor TaxID=4558 RepID=A0A921QA93_SORBI|nr:hypothetical protein BDA96_09G177400 [Sorghum bicolor]KAG0518459.1 hypothetical protein BDA96_09G177400 [Sorghum bicolor]OQU78159.1 hypothetical protein SORBI_3009G168150 [Sorghum bicolor]
MKVCMLGDAQHVEETIFSWSTLMLKKVSCKLLVRHQQQLMVFRIQCDKWTIIAKLTIGHVTFPRKWKITTAVFF